jgi:hypothetical protein
LTSGTRCRRIESEQRQKNGDVTQSRRSGSYSENLTAQNCRADYGSNQGN